MNNLSLPDSAVATLYPIRTVAAQTGVNPVTLRAWERRYGLIKPARSTSGHRLYTPADIETIHRVTALLDKGISISQVRQALAEPATGRTGGGAEGPWEGFRQQLISAIRQFDENRLDDRYSEILALYPADIVTRRVLLPLLEELGRRWETAEGSVAEEHFFGVYLRNKLGARFHHRHRNNSGPRLLAACLPGEQHETGLLLFALAAHEHGYQLILLGADMPWKELPHAARRARADAIVLSGSTELSPAELADRLPELVTAAGIPVFVGGMTSVRRRNVMLAAGAEPLGSDITNGLRRIDSILKPDTR